MKNLNPITIIGGGLAGLTLGIGLRRRNIPATVWEAGHYPRHRVCGEFVSGRGLEVLKRWELLPSFLRAGARWAATARFFSGCAQSPVRPVAPPALCLSRLEMDRLLAERFRSEGGDLREHSRWPGQAGAEGLVWAGGRRIQPAESGWRWFGLKFHMQGAKLEADLEMHSVQDGYVGLCRLPGGAVNVCGLFRARSAQPADEPRTRERLKGRPGTALYRHLADGRIVEGSFCATAGLPLRPQRALKQETCRLGDALTMIPPVTGNGMSMAFEAAEIALEPLVAYARHELSWTAAQRMIATQCDAAFRQRLAWAKWLQWMMFAPALRGGLGTFALRSGWLWRLLFTKTR